MLYITMSFLIAGAFYYLGQRKMEGMIDRVYDNLKTIKEVLQSQSTRIELARNDSLDRVVDVARAVDSIIRDLKDSSLKKGSMILKTKIEVEAEKAEASK